jgi:hypothetical protein
MLHAVEASCPEGTPGGWVFCFDTIVASDVTKLTPLLVLAYGSGMSAGVRFPNGLHLEAGLIYVVSDDGFELMPNTTQHVLVSFDYTTDTWAQELEVLRDRYLRRPDDPHRVEASLLDFLRTGALGPIRVGLSRDQIETLLGRPDNFSEAKTKDGQPAIYKYGEIELFFNDEQILWLIHADDLGWRPDGLLGGGPAIDLDPWVLRGGMTWEDVEPHLVAAGIAFTRRAWKYDNETLRYWVGPRIELLFRLPTIDTRDESSSCPDGTGLHAITQSLDGQ